MRLLVVENYAPLRKAPAKGLREAGYAVDATGDGEEALWFATTGVYDVVVLDLMLPGLDGLTVLKRLRAEGRPHHVLILTARDTVADRVRGLDLGADDYLVKPFAFEELLARVRALGRRAYGAKAPALKVADLRVETTARGALSRRRFPLDNRGKMPRIAGGVGLSRSPPAGERPAFRPGPMRGRSSIG